MLLKNILITQVGELGVNCYTVYCEDTRECAVIDPGAEPEAIDRKIASLKLAPKFVLLTHGHYDHIGAVNYFMEKYAAGGIRLACHEAEVETITNPMLNYSAVLGEAVSLAKPDISLKEGDAVAVGTGVRLEVIHTPGHTFGGVCYKYGEKALFSGDTLFLESIGRTDLHGGDMQKLINGIKTKLFVLSDDMTVFPGHGPHTTIGGEKRHNMFIG